VQPVILSRSPKEAHHFDKAVSDARLISLSEINIKGIVSRDFLVGFLVLFDRSEVPTHTVQRMFVCFQNFVFVSNFSIFASRRVSLLELAFSPPPGLTGEIIFYWFYIGK
jgi:hypothetical protein